jgi:hypothetical protein
MAAPVDAKVREAQSGTGASNAPSISTSGGSTKMAVEWNKDADAALSQAKAEKRPLLVDFSAAPA